MKKEEIDVLKKAKKGEFLLLGLHYREVGYGGGKFNWETPAIVDHPLCDKGILLCCSDSRHKSPGIIFIHKLEKFQNEKDPSLTITGVKKISKEEAWSLVRKMWHKIPFGYKKEIASDFGFRYEVEKREIEVAVHLLYE